jgi:hypothetical protein
VGNARNGQDQPAGGASRASQRRYARFRHAAERAIDEFLLTTGIAGSPVETSLGDLASAGAESTGQTGSWWASLKQLWKGEHHEVTGREHQWVELSSYWLTLPDISGAKVTLTSTVSNSKEASASLAIAGVGGGPAFTMAVEESVDFEASSDERAALRALGTFERIEVTKDGRCIAEYARLRSIDHNTTDWLRERAAAPDPADLGSVLRTQGFTITGATGTSTKKLSIDRGTSWNLGLDLTLPQLGLTVTLEGTLTYEQDVDYAYQIPKGHDYEATVYEALPAFLWRLK